MSEVTRLLSMIESGDQRATHQLLPLVYGELRKLAASRLANEAPGQTLQATALVHEVYIRLVGSDDKRWENSAHFFGAASRAMQRILVENARHKRRLKRGGGVRKRVELEDVEPAAQSTVDLVALDEALQKLEKLDQRKAELIRLRFFGGLTHAQAANVLGISTSTADNDWAYAKSWLRIQIEGAGD